MPAWNRNEPLAEKRRVMLFIETIDGEPAPATTSFSGTNELLVDKATGDFVAASGTLSNTKRPLVIDDDVIEAVDTGANETLTLTAHGLFTGDGPVQFTTDDMLPGGISAATDYWVIRFDADKISIAVSLADALTGTRVDLTSAGVGTNTLVDTASTQRLNDGLFLYEATQAEINYRGSYFGIRVAKTGFKDYPFNIDLHDEQQIHAGTAAAGAASSITLDGGASATNDLYRDCIVMLVGGTGSGQANTIASYAGGTKVATLARDWAINPDATSQFVIVPAPSGANPASVATAVGARIIEGAHTHDDVLRGLVGAYGRTEGYNTNTVIARSLNGAKIRWTWTVDETGRLTATPGDWT